MKRKLFITLAVILLLVGGFYAFVSVGSSKSLDSEYPVPELTVESNETMLEHGRYLVYGPAHCAHCHSPIDQVAALERGEEVDMTGGFAFALPIGTIYSPNITPDKETGIGNLSDGQIYRMLRHNIRHDGQMCIDFMPFCNMSDYDIKSVIAYIKSRPAVKSQRYESEYNFLGKTVRTLVLKPSEPTGQLTEYIKRDSSVAYGQYLCESVANCRGCHTERDLKSGEYIGEPYAGGFKFGPDASTGGWTFVTPNITPDKDNGIITYWDEQQFIDRMRNGRVHQYSPMPWGPFSRLSDSDLKAIYRYLQTVPPVARPNAPTATPPVG